MLKQYGFLREPTMSRVSAHDAVPAGERLLFEGSNSTFHRSISDDYVLRLTDRALYLPVFRGAPFRVRKCWRIPTELIAGTDVQPWRLPTLVFVGGLTLVVTCLSLTLWEIYLGLPELSVRSAIMIGGLAAAVSALTVMAMSLSDNRTEFIVTLRSGQQLRFITPADSYDDEKRYDRQVLERAQQACQDAGFG
jgi:hypothetical protein